MRVLNIAIIICLTSSLLKAQSSYDQLNSNTSGAFVLMGLSPTEIANPTNLGEFAASVQDATENLSVLPENYAIEVPLYSKDKGMYKKNRVTLSAGYSRETQNIDSKC